MRGIFDLRQRTGNESRIGELAHSLIRGTFVDTGDLHDHVITPQVGWDFWLAWMLAQVLWFGEVSLLVSHPLLPAPSSMPSVNTRSIPDGMASLLAGALLGVLPGVTQGVALWKLIRHTGWWTLTVIAGCMFSFTLSFYSSGPIVFSAAVGTSAGILQWLILMVQFDKAERWILANIVGWAIGGLAGFSVVGLIATVASVAITGYTLSWILQHPLRLSTRRR
jgi:hypothetical protein